MRIKVLIGIALSLVLLLSVHQAVALDETSEAALYTESVPAKTQSLSERDQLIALAFQRLLVRLSGSSAILDKAPVKQVLKKVDIFVSQFAFEGFREGNPSHNEQSLKVTFAAKPIRQLIMRSGFAIWDTPRPNTLVWLGFEKEGQALRWVNAEQEPEIWQQVNALLSPLKVPVLMPLLDLVDQTELSPELASRRSFEHLPTIMHRYGAGACLLGLVKEHPGGWQAEWRLFDPSLGEAPQKTWETIGLALPEVLQEGINQFGLYLADPRLPSQILLSDEKDAERSQDQEPLLSTEEQDEDEELDKLDPQNTRLSAEPAALARETEIAVAGIRNSAQYAQVLQYLKVLIPEAKVEIKRIAAEYTLFGLQPSINRDHFLRRIGQEAFLVESSDPARSDQDAIIYCDLLSTEQTN